MGLNRRDRAFQFTQYYRITRCGMGGFIGQFQDIGRSKTGGQSLQAPCGIFPIGITTGSSEQVNLPLCTLQKRRAQFCNKGLIVPHCSRQSGIQSSIIK